MNFIVPLLTAVIALLFAHHSVIAQSSGALLEKAIELIDKKDYETAEQMLQKVMDQEPRNALGHYYMAETIIRQRRVYDTKLHSAFLSARAYYHYRKAVEFDPNSRQGLDALAKSIRIEKGSSGRETICYFEQMLSVDDCQKNVAPADPILHAVRRLNCIPKYLGNPDCFKALR